MFRYYSSSVQQNRGVLPRRWHGSLVVLLIVVAGPLSAQTQSETSDWNSADLEYFETHVRPVLVEHCLECHGADPDKIRGGLWLTSREQMLAGGDSGPAIIPGKPEDSLLIQSVRHEAFEMPPEGALESEVVERLAEWIRRGAPDPRQPGQAGSRPKEIDLREGRQFWAFQPVTPVQAPILEEDDWSQSDLDRMVLRQLREVGLAPSPDTDRATLLRRLHLVLTGLPPTPEQIRRFVNSEQPLAHDLEQQVDRLLASPRFGERWGRHWLDVARFAESSGGGRSLMFPHAWRYRDYVIDSFNQDKPFDRMIREQIAGDLLPYPSLKQKREQLIGAGFLALGPTNYEQQDKELLRMEVIDEQVDTIGRAFLGMTLGCARCHDHKFDPIPTRDYYALAGILGSTQSLVDGNVSSYVTHSLATEAQEQAASKYQQQLQALNQQLKQVDRQLEKRGESSTDPATPRRIVASQDLPGIIVDDQQAKRVGNWTRSTSVPQYVDAGYVHDGSEARGEKQIVFAPRLAEGGNYEVRLAYSAGGNRASNARVTVDHQDGKHDQRINQSEAPPIDGLWISLGSFRFEADNLAQVTVSNDDADGYVIADAVQFLKTGSQQEQDQRTEKPTQPSTSPPESDAELTRLRQRRQRLDQQLKQLKQAAPRPLDLAMSVKDVAQPTDGHVHIRGNVRQLGEQVPRGFLQVVTPMEDWPEIPTNASGRRELAEWIADPGNPLTARVYVNRVWRHVFGMGLVATPDNFGSMGRAPSHPELLDFLAQEFVRQGWSTKRLLRTMLLSRTFWQSSRSRPEAALQDPENRWLWRMNPRRLDAEVIRDSMLQVAGELDLQSGGLTIRKLQQYDLGYKFDTLRRSVYVPAFRNSMLPLFEVFDVANPNLVVGHRNTSTLPTQALYLMNSPWVIARSQHAAERLLELPLEDPQRLEQIYLQIVGRTPEPDEVSLSLEYLAGFDDRHEGWSSLIHSLFGSLDFRYVH